MACSDTRIDPNNVRIAQHEEILKRLDAATRAACCVLQYLEADNTEEGFERIINSAYPELKKWWKNHKKADCKQSEESPEKWVGVQVSYYHPESKFSMYSRNSVYTSYCHVFASTEKEAIKKAKKYVKAYRHPEAVIVTETEVVKPC